MAPVVPMNHYGPYIVHTLHGSLYAKGLGLYIVHLNKHHARAFGVCGAEYFY